MAASRAHNTVWQLRLITEAVVVPHEPPPSTAILDGFTCDIPQCATTSFGDTQSPDDLKAPD